MSEYKLKTGKLGEAFIDAYRKTEEHVVDGYKKIEHAFADKFLEEIKSEEEHQS